MRLVFPALVCLLLLTGCCGLCGFISNQPLPPLNVTISESLNPEYGVYVVDRSGKEITKLRQQEYFFPVQRGLPDGTAYGFRLLRADRSMAVSLNEQFISGPISNGLGYELGAQQFNDFPAGKYMVELVVIEGQQGTIVARSDFTLFDPIVVPEESKNVLVENCSEYLPKQGNYSLSKDEDGRQLIDCASQLAAALNDTQVCRAVEPYFGGDMWARESCMVDMADKNGNLEYCGGLYRAVDRAICRAKRLNSGAECLNMNDCDFYWSCDEQKQVCLQNFALGAKDAALCRELKNDDYRNRCLGMVLLDKSYCEQVSDNESRASCIGYVDNSPD